MENPRMENLLARVERLTRRDRRDKELNEVLCLINGIPFVLIMGSGVLSIVVVSLLIVGLGLKSEMFGERFSQQLIAGILLEVGSLLFSGLLLWVYPVQMLRRRWARELHTILKRLERVEGATGALR